MTAERFRAMFPTAETGPGPWLGALTDRSVRVWVRSPDGEPLTAVLRIDGRVVAETQLLPDADHDGIAAGDLTAERSCANQGFEVEVAGAVLRGMMAPRQNEPAEFSFLVGSCNQPFVYKDGRAELGPANLIYGPMADAMTRHDVRFSLFVGDQAYADGVEGLSVPDWARENPDVGDAALLEHYRRVYRAYFGGSGINDVLSRAPSFMIWDDHEIFDCWGSHEDPSALDRRMFRAAQAAYVEYEHVRNPGTGLDDQPPFHYQFWFGDVGFLVLDLRGEREYSEARVIGEAQWLGLQDFLTEAAARNTRTVFITSSIPVVHFSPRMAYLTSYLPARKAALSRDRWDSAALTRHRQRLLAILFGWQSEEPGRKVVLLSGDVHAAAAFRVRQRGGRGVITQWTSSAMCTAATLGHSAMNYFGTAFANWGDTECDSKLIGLEARNNFGIIRVVPSGEGHRLQYNAFRYDAKTNQLKRAFSDTV